MLRLTLNSMGAWVLQKKESKCEASRPFIYLILSFLLHGPLSQGQFSLSGLKAQKQRCINLTLVTVIITIYTEPWISRGQVVATPPAIVVQKPLPTQHTQFNMKVWTEETLPKTLQYVLTVRSNFNK